MCLNLYRKIHLIRYIASHNPIFCATKRLNEVKNRIKNRSYLQRLAVQFGALGRSRPMVLLLAGATVIVRHVHLIGVGELFQLAGANLLQER